MDKVEHRSTQRPRRRRAEMALAAGTVVLASWMVAVTTGGTAAAKPAQAAEPPGLSVPIGAGHTYRHGALPLRTLSPASASSVVPEHGPPNGRSPGQSFNGRLRYSGGPVVNGSPKVYLVFWGRQWGSESTVGGYRVFAGDPAGIARELQAYYSGLGTNRELWSAVVAQYCLGVAFNAKACPVAPASNHVAYPHLDVLGGVWEDTSYQPPLGSFPGDSNVGGATATQLAQEASTAAVHFGDSSIDAQYIIVSPHLANPDGWLDPISGYCAYHDNTQDLFFNGTVTGPNVAYTNLPYIPDAGLGSCSSTGKSGPLDGTTETASHEYAETLTDPYPTSGWSDRGSEIGDKCDYLDPGQPGAATYLTLATGTFDVQGIWANDSGKKGGCEVAHSSILTANPGKQKTVVGVPVNQSVGGIDLFGLTVRYDAIGLPSGLSVNPGSGVISGTPTQRRTSEVTVTASDTSSAATFSFRWTVSRH